MIQVTHTFLPQKERLLYYIDQIYKNGIVTNNGPLVHQFEEKLRVLLQTDYVMYVNSGHTALMMAVKTLKNKGPIITTPFSFVSTLQAILWNGYQPIFSDIESKTLSIDPNLVENTIKKYSNITAIVATHLFGNICDVKALEYLSNKYQIPIIYDAAHSFGMTYENQSVFNYGKLNAISFQAYKPLHTVEGGAILTQDLQLYEQLFNMRYFGLDLEGNVQTSGLNGKNSEIHAAFGLCNLENWEERLAIRKSIYQQYLDFFNQTDWEIPQHREHLNSNYSYFPIICKSKKQREALENYLYEKGIQTKRYFTPSLNTLTHLGFEYSKIPISESIAQRILCIPMHADLSQDDVQFVIESIKDFRK